MVWIAAFVLCGRRVPPPRCLAPPSPPHPHTHSLCTPALRCRIQDALEEPAGLFFEACGGWDNHRSDVQALCAATAAAQPQQEQPPHGPQPQEQPQEEVGEQEPNQPSTKRAKLYILCSSSDDDEETAAAVASAAAAAAEPQERSLHPASGYAWEASGCVSMLPPLRPGEARELGVTLTAREVRGAVGARAPPPPPRAASEAAPCCCRLPVSGACGSCSRAPGARWRPWWLWRPPSAPRTGACWRQTLPSSSARARGCARGS